MKKRCRKCANSKSQKLIRDPKQPLHARNDILKENDQKAFKKLTLFSSRTTCHPCLTRISLVCHSYVTRMYSYVIRMYQYVIHMSLVCTRISTVCHSYVLVCHPYVTRIYSYVIRMSLVCGFTMNLCTVQKKWKHMILIFI